MKKKLIFDVTEATLTLGSSKPRGVFFVIYNVLRFFCESGKFDIYLYSDHPRESIGILKERYFSDCKLLELPNFVLNFLQLKGKIYDSEVRKRGFKYYSRRIRYLFFKFLFFICGEKFDILFSAYHVRPKWGDVVNKKFFIIYDLIPLLLKNYNSLKADFLHDVIAPMELDNYYFSISEYTKRDFLKFVPNLRDEQISVTHLAASDSFFYEKSQDKIAIVRGKYGIPDGKKYIFTLGAVEPRKNQLRIAHTFIEFIKKHNINDLVYLVGGPDGKLFIDQLKSQVAESDGLEQIVYYIGYVDDEDLPVLYSCAEWFVYTSEYEGFGLPNLEAMKCGCPVISANNSSFPEVVGDAGILIDFDSDEQHIKAYETYYFHPEIRDSHKRNALLQAQKFSWEMCTKIMIDKMLAE